MFELSPFRVAGFKEFRFMSGLEKYFNNPNEIRHPKIGSWSKIIQEGKPTCEIDRKREGFGFRRAKIYLHVDISGKTSTDQDDWDDELNQFLLQHKVRSISPKNEQIRYALTIKNLLKKAEIRFGDGYFNAVLLELVKSAFREKQDVQEKVEEIAPSKPSHEKAYEECATMIEGAIAACAKSLLNDLGYEQPEAENILAGAMGYYLDERFSLTNRKLLGLT
jgi:hypothetical protein